MGLTSLKLSHLFCGLSALAAGLFMPGFVGLTSLKLSRFIIGPFCRSLGPSVGPFFFSRLAYPAGEVFVSRISGIACCDPGLPSTAILAGAVGQTSRAWFSSVPPRGRSCPFAARCWRSTSVCCWPCVVRPLLLGPRPCAVGVFASRHPLCLARTHHLVGDCGPDVAPALTSGLLQLSQRPARI